MGLSSSRPSKAGGDRSTILSPHFSRPREKCARSADPPLRIGASREGFRPGKLLSKQLATGDLLTSWKTCEKVRLEAVSNCERSSGIPRSECRHPSVVEPLTRRLGRKRGKGINPRGRENC